MRRCGTILLLVALSLTATACLTPRPRTPSEQALVGTWVSDNDPTTFIFLENGSYTMDDGEGRINATYREVNEGDTLHNKRFLLDRSGIIIQFSATGDTFRTEVDGSLMGGIWHRQTDNP